MSSYSISNKMYRERGDIRFPVGHHNNCGGRDEYKDGERVTDYPTYSNDNSTTYKCFTNEDCVNQSKNYQKTTQVHKCELTTKPKLDVEIIKLFSGTHLPRFRIINQHLDANRYGFKYWEYNKVMPTGYWPIPTNYVKSADGGYFFVDSKKLADATYFPKENTPFTPGKTYEASAGYSTHPDNKYTKFVDIDNVVQFTIPALPVVVKPPTKQKIPFVTTAGPDWIKVVVAASVPPLDFGLWINDKLSQLQKNRNSREYTFTGLKPNTAYRVALNKPGSSYDITRFGVTTPAPTAKPVVTRFDIIGKTTTTITIKVPPEMIPYKVKIQQENPRGRGSDVIVVRMPTFEFKGLTPNTEYTIYVGKDNFQTLTKAAFTLEAKPEAKPVVPAKPIVQCPAKAPQKTKTLGGKSVCCPAGSSTAFFKGTGFVCCPKTFPHAYKEACHQCPESSPYMVNGKCSAKTVVKPKPTPVCAQGMTTFGNWCCPTVDQRPNAECRSIDGKTEKPRKDVPGAGTQCLPGTQWNVAAKKCVTTPKPVCPPGTQKAANGACVCYPGYARNADVSTGCLKKVAFSTTLLSPTSISVRVTDPTSAQSIVTAKKSNGPEIKAMVSGGKAHVFSGLDPNTGYKITVTSPNRGEDDRIVVTSKPPVVTPKPCPTAQPYFYKNACNTCPETTPYQVGKTCLACPAGQSKVNGVCKAPGATTTPQCRTGFAKVGAYCCPGGNVCSDGCTSLVAGKGSVRRGAIDPKCDCVSGYTRFKDYCCKTDDESPTGVCLSVKTGAKSDRDRVNAPVDSICDHLKNQWMCSVIEKY